MSIGFTIWPIIVPMAGCRLCMEGGTVVGNIDLQPIVVAVAGLIVAMTPVAVTYLHARVSSMDLRLTAGQERIEAKVDALPRQTAAAVRPSVEGAATRAVEKRAEGGN